MRQSGRRYAWLYCLYDNVSIVYYVSVALCIYRRDRQFRCMNCRFIAYIPNDVINLMRFSFNLVTLSWYNFDLTSAIGHSNVLKTPMLQPIKRNHAINVNDQTSNIQNNWFDICLVTLEQNGFSPATSQIFKQNIKIDALNAINLNFHNQTNDAIICLIGLQTKARSSINPLYHWIFFCYSKCWKEILKFLHQQENFDIHIQGPFLFKNLISISKFSLWIYFNSNARH